MQLAAPDGPDEVGHYARLQHVVQDMSRLVRDAGEAALHFIRARAGEAVHVQRRIGEPVVSGDVGVEAAIAVGDDVESGDFLVAHVHRDGIEVLLAIAAIDHRFAEIARAEVLCIPAGPRQ